MEQIVVIGGGAAGMMAAIAAARTGKKVCLFEKNEKLGKKLFITGKGRCNVTNACETEALFQNVMSNSKFLYSAFYTMTNADVVQFFEELGLQTKVERGLRVFPLSDKSSDVIRVLQEELERQKVKIEYGTVVKEILYNEETMAGVRLENGKRIEASSVIVATGGASYVSTGSTGDGYRFAKEAGHTVTPLVPSLVPIEIKEDACKRMQGLSLKNIKLTLLAGKKKLYEEFGEMIFTHFGMSGPVVLSASVQVQNYVLKKKKKEEPLIVELDLKPALSVEKLDARILRDFSEEKNKYFKNSLEHLLPKKLIPIIIEWSRISPEKKVNEITREERQNLVQLLKHMRFYVSGTRGFQEAIITKGGVAVKEVDPSTMESKKKRGLYFVGEVLDLDALTGGFNLQIAWSTGYLAGISCQG